jgi:hypothetical protein
VSEGSIQIEMRTRVAAELPSPGEVKVQWHAGEIRAVIPWHVAAEIKTEALTAWCAKVRDSAEGRLPIPRYLRVEADPHEILTAQRR